MKTLPESEGSDLPSSNFESDLASTKLRRETYRNKFQPFPGCQHCRDLVDNSPHSFGKLWNASEIFHGECADCLKDGDAEEDLSSLLCAECKHLRLRHISYHVPREQLPKHLAIRNVVSKDSSAKKDCPLCNCLDNMARGSGEAHGDDMGRLSAGPQPDRMKIQPTKWQSSQVQWRVTGNRGTRRFREEGGFLIVQDSLSSTFQLPPSGSTGNPHSKHATHNYVQQKFQDWEHLQSCLLDCYAEHPSCNLKLDIRLPTNFRFLDVKRRCLVTYSSTSDAIPGFVTLSYVWGQSQDLDGLTRTTMSNIRELHEIVDISTLPATMRDAVVVCERLGERYLWIDRLCIIQDDADDMFSQINAMSAIYSATKLVIVAAHGDGMSSGLAGISQPRAAHFHKSFSGMQVNVQLQPLWDALDASVWCSRAWTYQEVILARRKLFFTSTQVFFECTLRINHEEMLLYSSFDPSLHDKDAYRSSTTTLVYSTGRWKRSHVTPTRRVSETYQEPLRSAFQRHLERYRSRDLTYQSDILNGFLGILHALYPDEGAYFGLPVPLLDISLLWARSNALNSSRSIRDGRPRVRENDPARAPCGLFPSWSWAASPNIPQYTATGFDFRGTLVCWFRPRECGSVGGSGTEIDPVYSVDGGTEWSNQERTSHASLYMAMALRAGLVELSTAEPARQEWIDMPADKLLTLVRDRWATYSDYWHEIFDAPTLRNTKASILSSDAAQDIRDGVLAGRAQCGRFRVVMEDVSMRKWLQSAKVVDCHGDQVGWCWEGELDKVAEHLNAGADMFWFVALSVSTAKKNVFMEKKTKNNKRTRDDMETGDESEIIKMSPLLLSASTPKPPSHADSVSGVGNKDDHPVFESKYAYDTHKMPKPDEIPAICTMVVERRGNLCYRLGLATIYMDDWVKLQTTFETILLG